MNQGIETIEYRTWEQFKENILKDLFKTEKPQKGRFIFRGQSNADWALISSFDRIYSDKKLSKKLLDNFKKEYQNTTLSSNDSQVIDDESLLALGQHYGLPTRLLDWTDSHYIAAFFAFSSCLNSEHQFIAVWALDAVSPIWNEEDGVKIVMDQKFSNARIRNQNGLFTLLKTPSNSLNQYASSFDLASPALIRLILPTSEAKKVLIDLDFMGISFSKVYPDIEGAVKSAISKCSI